MADIKHKTSTSPNHLRQQSEPAAPCSTDAAIDAKRPVIELADLTSGAEAEAARLKSAMASMSATIEQMRSENVRLTTDNQKLTAELREIKLVLAKVHAKELRTIERGGSWIGSLNLPQGVFGKNHDDK